MNDELRAMTKNQRSFDRPVMMSSEMPSAIESGQAANGHVRFTPKSGHVQCKEQCPLWAISGHSVQK